MPCFDLSVAGPELSPPTQEVALDVVAYPGLLGIRFPRAATKVTGAGPVRFAVGDSGCLAALRVEWSADQRNALLAELP